MRAPAFIRQIRARLTGYFWLPCPRCGKHFAGYEDHGGTDLRADWSGGTVCCSNCPGDKVNGVPIDQCQPPQEFISTVIRAQR